MQNKDLWKKRQQKVYSYLNEEGVDMAILEDKEDRREPSIRYLSGMPGDALLFLTSRGESVLVPWDINLAEDIAWADKIIPYSEFRRDFVSAVKEINEEKGATSIEVFSTIPYTLFQKLSSSLPLLKFICSENGIDKVFSGYRICKDEMEISLYRKISEITNSLIGKLETELQNGNLTREIDVALFLERGALDMNSEGMGFETIVAGPKRSFGIHAFPAYTGASITQKGFTIIDFGVKLEGYSSDVTTTIVRGPLSPIQETMCSVVEKAYNTAAELLEPGIPVSDVAGKVDLLFAENGFSMPHSLGHGIGLKVHEQPVLKQGTEAILEAGMIITLEPGLYDKTAGGIRLENDFLITANGSERLTNSRIIRIPDKL